MLNTLKKIISLSLILTSFSAFADYVTVSYDRPFYGTTIGGYGANFVYLNMDQNGNTCPNNSVDVFGSARGQQASQTFYTQPMGYNHQTISFVDSEPKPIQWTMYPWNTCIPNFSGGTSGFANLVADSPSVQTTKTGKMTYNFGSGVFTLSTVGSLYPSYLPAQLKYTDTSTGKVTQMYFAGCSDNLYSSHTQIDCCYVSDSTGNPSLCPSTQQ